MSPDIPLEDQFQDIIGKVQRGLRLGNDELARKAGIDVKMLAELQAGKLHTEALIKVASALHLGSTSLLALAESRYIPAAIEGVEGIRMFNTPFDEMTVNSYVIWDPATSEAALFDTGSDGQPMLDFTEKHGLNVTQIFLTHAHIDHIFDLDRLIEKTGAHARIGNKEALAGVEHFAAGETFRIGTLDVATRLTSGHSPGGITYFISGLASPLAIVGDSMFAGSMGGGVVSYADALGNNREQILTLPDNTIICPGHGPPTTVGEQKNSNPFFAA
jgi:hydroxyacylglutathione hydrolase